MYEQNWLHLLLYAISLKMDCEICERKIKGKGAWLNKQKICEKCWRVHRYGDMQEYLIMLKLKKMKGGKK